MAHKNVLDWVEKKFKIDFIREVIVTNLYTLFHFTI